MTARRKPRIVFLNHCAKLSGGEIALVRLLPALQQDADALVILGEDGPLVAKLRAIDAPVDVLPLAPRTRDLGRSAVEASGANLLNGLRVLPHTVGLARRLRSVQADVVHTNSLKAAVCGGMAGRLAGVPVVWHVRDRISPDYMPASAGRLVRRASSLLPHALIANSVCTLGCLPTRPGSAVVYDPYEPTRAAATRPVRPLRVGVLGRLAPWKGQHVFLEAFARALGGSTATARIIGIPLFGEHEYEAQLHRQAEDLGIAHQVEFRGFCADVEAELAELDVLAHCSTSPEPFGQVVVEGMAAGLPVVASAEGGPAEIVRTEVDGLLVAPRDTRLLAGALRRLAEDPALRARLGAAAVLSSRRFSGAASAAGVLAVYDLVLGKGAARRP